MPTPCASITGGRRPAQMSSAALHALPATNPPEDCHRRILSVKRVRTLVRRFEPEHPVKDCPIAAPESPFHRSSGSIHRLSSQASLPPLAGLPSLFRAARSCIDTRLIATTCAGSLHLILLGRAWDAAAIRLGSGMFHYRLQVGRLVFESTHAKFNPCECAEIDSLASCV